jgi:hypothetical protein
MRFHKRSTVTVFENFSIYSSYALIQKGTIFNKNSKILKNNSRLVYLMNTVLTEPEHIVYMFTADLNHCEMTEYRKWKNNYI